MDRPLPAGSTGQASWQRVIGAALTLGLLIFCASLLGVYSRFETSLASVWPANALMVGVLLRMPLAARWPGWVCAVAGYIAADLLTGSQLLTATLLTLANIAGVATIYLIYRRQPEETLLIRHPMSMLTLALACVAVAGVIGSFANPLLFDRGIVQGWVLWFVTEFANYIAVLPVILAAPSVSSFVRKWKTCPVLVEFRQYPRPLLGLLIAGPATLFIGGPGAIAFPVPVLLWCATRYSVFTTAVLSLIASFWVLALIAQNSQYDENQIISLRIGVALVALGPVMLACVMRKYKSALATLQHLAAHDSLTATQTRAAFLQQARWRLDSHDGEIGVLMIDLDHFKQINDTYGHPVGDQVLVSAAARIRYCLRGDDLLGRLGGEEFAALISGVSVEELQAIAERIRESVAGGAITLDDQQRVSVTTSIGLSIRKAGEQTSIEALLATADKALYAAKHGGRNQVVRAA